ncbi:MAG TPA: AraC family transcriptional regulator [Clostridiaceae bacterium]|nr:AraC family transcriptional regulator [Clostridiaceae bacterium]
MFLDGLHEKGIFSESYPFRLVANTEENFDYPFHWHKALEIIYAMESDYEVIVNNANYVLDERDILLISGGDIHGFHVHGNRGKRIFIQFDITKLKGFGFDNSLKLLISKTRKISYQNDKDLHRMLEEQIIKMIEDYNKNDLASPLYLSARVYDILSILARHCANWIMNETPVSGSKRIYGLEKLNGALKYIEENYHKDITLKSVASASGFSEYYFSRLFKEVTEKNFCSYLKELRVKKAEKLLADSDMLITQVAYASGFKSITSFNRTFKEIKGCTPTEYKKMRV